MSLAVVYQSHDLSLINLVGLVVCLLGISCHVVRKATALPDTTTKKQNSRYIRYVSVLVLTRLHLLNLIPDLKNFYSDPDL